MSEQGLKRLSVENYAQGILNKDRVMLGKAITLIESKLSSDEILAIELLERIFPYSGQSLRLGITGVPGVGKSTFIESFGELLINKGLKVAVLAIDPSSQKTKGSILGDKTRMEQLSKNLNAFIRPSASGNTLGGVAGKTRETVLLCEAAGFDVVIIETVGVGQSETAVHDMVDFFLLLMLAGAGDELQGIKKGIMEMADALVITKADGDNMAAANRAKIEYQNALHLFPANANGWTPQVRTASALSLIGVEEIWKTIKDFENHTRSNGHWLGKRKEQNIAWMHAAIQRNLLSGFYKNAQIKLATADFERKVAQNEVSATKAAYELLSLHLQTK